MKSFKDNKGETLIEVLITSFVISTGVLGATGMQVTTLKNLSSSVSTDAASLLASDIVERMRSNPIASLVDEYEHTTAPSSYTDCAGSACSSGDLATYDIAKWQQQLSDQLASATGQISRNAGTNTFAITVRWDDDRSGSVGTNCPVLSSDDLDCYQSRVTF